MSVYASHKDAVQSGLFGLFGEERVALVDAGVDAQIRLFDEFSRVHGSSEDCQTAHLFQKCRASSAELFKCEMRDCEKDWLITKPVYVTP